jgi:hypothetical protein
LWLAGHAGFFWTLFGLLNFARTLLAILGISQTELTRQHSEQTHGHGKDSQANPNFGQCHGESRFQQITLKVGFANMYQSVSK